jgi:hypothetical protein
MPEEVRNNKDSEKNIIKKNTSYMLRSEGRTESIIKYIRESGTMNHSNKEMSAETT